MELPCYAAKTFRIDAAQSYRNVIGLMVEVCCQVWDEIVLVRGQSVVVTMDVVLCTKNAKVFGAC